MRRRSSGRRCARRGGAARRPGARRKRSRVVARREPRRSSERRCARRGGAARRQGAPRAGPHRRSPRAKAQLGAWRVDVRGAASLLAAGGGAARGVALAARLTQLGGASLAGACRRSSGPRRSPRASQAPSPAVKLLPKRSILASNPGPAALARPPSRSPGATGGAPKSVLRGRCSAGPIVRFTSQP